ncbi:hypothetical protein [Roseateles violae]|uniref:Uncharacterized protein n=1 Tax=Roseateles violae TaxID=3058042 RepID=A0ABT8DRS4_9BURK|nr:hypothetical protein [Pelomonas sp. PFR6]MDN3919624.1 hypothetical protein [Pelomonas sp. PFR6]
MKQPSDVDMGFSYRQRKNEVVELLHHGRLASLLRGRDALDFMARVQSAEPAEVQRLMARITGNYKRGNERLAASHGRHRR